MSRYAVNDEGSVVRNPVSLSGTSRTINEDGTVTFRGRRNTTGHTTNTTNNNSGKGSGNWRRLIVASGIAVVIIGCVIGFSGSCDDGFCTDEETRGAEESAEGLCATFLRVSDDEISIDPSGGSRTIYVYSDGDWRVSVGTEPWIVLGEFDDRVEIDIAPNADDSRRSDWFVVEAGSLEKRITISQRGDDSPSAKIKNIWMEHNVYVDGDYGMKIHVDFDTKHTLNRRINMYIYFYQENNVTPVYKANGDEITASVSNIDNYEYTAHSDWWCFVPHDWFAHLAIQGGKKHFSFDILIKDEAGNTLARINNTRFILSWN